VSHLNSDGDASTPDQIRPPWPPAAAKSTTSICEPHRAFIEPIGSRVLVRLFARRLEIRDLKTQALLRTHDRAERPGTVVHYLASKRLGRLMGIEQNLKGVKFMVYGKALFATAAVFALLIGCSPSDSGKETSQTGAEPIDIASQIRAPLLDEQMLEEITGISSSSRDKSVGISFVGGGHILAKDSARGVGVQTINISELDLELIRIPERNFFQVLNKIGKNTTQLSGYQFLRLLEDDATPVWRGRVTIEGQKDVAVSTVLPLSKIIDSLPTGLFALVAADRNDKDALLPSRFEKIDGDDLWTKHIPLQWILNTNIAATTAAYPKGMLVNLRALDDAKPIRGAKLQLVTRNNEIVFEAESDRDGWVRIPEPPVRGKRANEPSHLVIRKDKDLAFVNLKAAPLDLSAFEISGRLVKGDIDAYLFTDRGIYRPRETVYLHALVRDNQGRNTANGKYELALYRPNGSIYLKQAVETQALGSIQQRFELPKDAPRGVWRLALLNPGESRQVGSTEIDVQDFVPEKLKVQILEPDRRLEQSRPLDIGIRVDYLFGAPGADLEVEAEAFLQKIRNALPNAPALANFLFGDSLQKTRPVNLTTQAVKTDSKGGATVRIMPESFQFSELSNGFKAAQPAMLHVNIGVQEPGGRATKTNVTLPVSNDLPIIAVKPGFRGQIDTNASGSFSVKKLDKTMSSVSVTGLKWQVQRLRWSWDYDRTWARWTHSKAILPNAIAQGSVTEGSGKPGEGSITLQPLDWGEYVLTVFDEQEKVYQRSSFYSGWSSNAESDEPDFLEIKAQSKNFTLGKPVLIGVEAPFDGHGMLTVWTDRPLHTQSISFSKGNNSFNLQTNNDWAPGAYIVVTALRPLGARTQANDQNSLSVERYLPARAMGILYLQAAAYRQLKVELPPDQTLKPRQKHNLPVKVPALAGKKGFVVIQAVDEGILQLTQFKTPSPENHFFGRRRLLADFFDDYSKLLRADGKIGDIRTGGDGSGGSIGGAALEVVPTRSTVIHAGPIELDKQGNVNISLDLPDFNGTLRAMVTVWGDEHFGSAHSNWVVRDPVVADVVMPRYLAPGDTALATLFLANTTNDSLSASIVITPEGALTTTAQPSKRPLVAGQRIQVDVPIRAEAEGVGKLKLKLDVPGQLHVERDWPITVRYAGTSSTYRGPAVKIQPNGSATLSLDFAKQAQSEGRKGQIIVKRSDGPFNALPAAYSVAALVSELLRYEWTCSEQLASKLTPILLAYQADPDFITAIATPVLGDKTLEAWLQEQVDRLTARQSSDGAIGLWRAGDDLVDPLLAAQLVETLAYAMSLKLKIPENSLTSAFAWAMRFAQQSDIDDTERLRARSRMMKAIAPYNPRAIRLARSLADEAVNPDALTRSNLAIALKAFGDNRRAENLKESIRSIAEQLPTNKLRYYESEISLYAQYAANLYQLELQTEASKVVEEIAVQLTRRKTAWASINEQGYLLRAQIALAEKQQTEVRYQNQKFTGKLGSVIIPLQPNDLKADTRQVLLTSETSAALEAFVQLQAPPLPNTSLESVRSGITVEKTVYSLRGTPRTDSLNNAKRNDRFIVLLKVSPNQSQFSGVRQLMVSDPLPAGFQIESVITAKMREEQFSWIEELTGADIQEATDTGFFAARLTNYYRDSSDLRLAYIVRATTPGQFLATQAIAQDMYDATLKGSSSGKPVRVTH